MKERLIELLDKNKNNRYFFRESVFKTVHKDIYDLLGDFNTTLSGKLFIFINDLKEIPKCKICNKELIFRDFKNGFGIYCSNKCSVKDFQKANDTREKNNLEKYGVKNVFQIKEVKDKIKDKNNNKTDIEKTIIAEKRKSTNIIKYGKPFIAQTNLIKNALKEKGVLNVSQLQSTKDKIKETNLIKYGETHHLKNKDILNKSLNSKLEKFKVFLKNEAIKYNLEFIDILDTKEIKYKCLICNNEFVTERKFFKQRIIYNLNNCLNCFPYKSTQTKPEYEIIDFLKTNGVLNIIHTDKTILKPKHLDIYIPDKNLAIEYNGFWTHNIDFQSKNNKTIISLEKYHQNKSKGCLDKNIQLLHIYEDDWLYKQKIVKSIILSKLNIFTNKIYARKCIIKELNNKNTKEFLIKNHLQGNINASINIGLVYNNELVSVMTFGKSKREKDKMEMYRFCNKLNTQVIGGASKLFKYYLNKLNNNLPIISYADFGYSNGNLYKQLGFNYIGLTIPNYFYIVNGIRIRREHFQNWKLNKKEKDYIKEKGYLKIFDSGNLKYEYIN